MQPPRFWSNPPERPGAMARLLSPLAALAAALTRRRLASGTPLKVGPPVICVGNINIGGTGKTPTVIALVERLKAGAPLNELDRATLYGGGAKGYTDYPTLVDA